MTATVPSNTAAPAAAGCGDARGLRVLAFCDYFQPNKDGGAERVALEVYRRLAAWGAAVTVVTTVGPATKWAADTGLRVVTVPAVDVTPRLRVQLSVTRGAAALAKRAADELAPHVMHANSLQFPTTLAAARLRRRTGIPLVVTAHLGGFEHLAPPWRSIATVHERTIGRFILSRSDRVIAVSESVRAHLAEHPSTRDRVRVVPNGVDHAVFAPAPPKGSSGSTTVEVLFVGRLVPNKGPAVLLDALAQLVRAGRNVRLTIVGDGPLRRDLQAHAAELRLTPHVRFVGHSDDVAAHLKGADVLVRPTLTEGMPLAVLEAMASCVSVVASDIPGNRGLIDDGVNGLLCRPGDAAALAAALDRAVSDRTLRSRLTAAGYRTAAQYSWDRCASETLVVLHEAVAARRQRSVS